MDRAVGSRELWIERLGVMDYARALDFQRAVAKARIANEIPEDVLLLLEHPPVVTMGRSSKEAHLLASPALLAARGVALFEVERGGDVTFHGPGQLVGYPIVRLADVREDLGWYMRTIEEMIIRGIARYGLSGGRRQGMSGVWCDDRKICAIGVRASRWVTMHGFALNVSTNPERFSAIVPCGIAEYGVTSIAAESGESPTLEEVAAAVVSEWDGSFAAEEG